MADVWKCASMAYDLVTKAKQSIDAGEISLDADDFSTARIHLRDTIELLDAIMADTYRKKSPDVKVVSVGNGKGHVFERNLVFHAILGNYPVEMRDGGPGQHPPSPGVRSVELP